MPLHIPHDGDTSIITNLAATGSATPGTSITTGATSATKGTAVELISAASNTQASWGVYVQVSNIAAAATASDCAVDILIGGATDTVLIPNLLAGYASDGTANGLRSWFFPLHIPAGVRIAAQAASLRTSTAMRVGVKLYGGTTPPFKVGTRVTTYGIGTVPNGTAFTPGASGAQGTFTQIASAAAMTEGCLALIPSFQVTNDTTVLAKTMKLGIGLGAATEELLGTWDYALSGNETISGPFDMYPIFRDVPSGTRLTIRGSTDGTADAGYDCVIHAVV